MRKTSLTVPFMAFGLGVSAGAGMFYYYSTMHPVKTKMAINDMRNMVKDLK